MEHLNREAKNCISGLGSNITDEAVSRLGNSLGEVVKVLKHFDSVNSIKVPSSRHSKRSCEEDLSSLIKQLLQVKVFEAKPGREHRNFVDFQCNSMRGLAYPELTQWMGEHLNKILTYH